MKSGSGRAAVKGDEIGINQCQKDVKEPKVERSLSQKNCGTLNFLKETMRTTSFYISFVAIATLFWFAPTLAGEYSVQELGSSEIRDNSFFEKKKTDVEILTPKDWEGKNFSLADFLAKQTGIQFFKQGGLGSFESISIRGISGKNILICIDGIAQNSANGGAFDLSKIDLNLIEKIEIYKNNIPAKFGNGKLGGAINFITKKSLQHSGKILASYGSYNFWETSAQISASPKDSFYISAGISTKHSDNDYEFKNRNGTLYDTSDDFTDKRENAEYTENSFSLQLRKLHANDFFSIFSIYGFHAEGGIPGREDYQTKIASFNGNFLQWHYRLETPEIKNGFWLYPGISGKLNKNMGESYYPLDHIGYLSSDFLEYGILHFSLAPEFYAEWNTNYFESSARIDLNYENGMPKGNSTDWELERFSSNISFDFLYNLISFLKFGSKIGTLFRQDEIDKGKFILPTGTRNLDKENLDDFSFMGNAFLIFEKEKFPLSASISFGRFFRQPELMELYGVFPGSISNPDLKEENALRFEASAFLEITPNTNLKTAYFESHTENGIYWITSGTFMKPENIGKAFIRGFEAALESKPLSFLEISLRATLQKTEDKSNSKTYKGNQLPGEPTHSYFSQIGLLFYPFTFHFSAAYKSVIYGDRAEKLKQPGTPHYTLSVSYDFLEKSRLIFAIDNLSDETYRHIYTPFPIPGREYRLTFIQNF